MKAEVRVQNQAPSFPSMGKLSSVARLKGWKRNDEGEPTEALHRHSRQHPTRRFAPPSPWRGGMEFLCAHAYLIRQLHQTGQLSRKDSK